MTITDYQLPYCTITGTFLTVDADSADEDSFPDVQPLNGTITLTPTTTAGRVDDAFAQILPVTVRVFGGQVVDDEDLPGVRILATDANIGVADWAWRASFKLDGLDLEPLTFKAPRDTTVNLTSGLVPIKSQPYQIIEGASIVDAEVSGEGTMRFELSDGTFTSWMDVPNGERGLPGEKGDPGAKGDDGAAATLAMGSVTAGATADAWMTGTSLARELHLSLPRGQKGDKGDPGDPATPITASVTVSEGAVAGGNVSLNGGNLDLSLTIPRGDWKQATISAGSLDDLTVQGSYPVQSTSVTGLPVARLGTLVHSGVAYPVQMYVTWETVPRVFVRHFRPTGWQAWHSVGWRTPDVPYGTDFDTLTTPGYSGVVTTSVTNGPPGAGIGTVEVLALGSGVLQRYTSWDASPRVWLRRGNAAGTSFYAWEQQPTPARVASIESRLATVEESTGGGGSGMKVVPLTMTAPGTPLSSTTDGGAVRWVRRYAHMPKRVRVHVSNRNPGNAINGGTDLNLSAIRVGAGDASGGYSAGVIAQTGGVIASDGSEIVTPWTTVPGLADGGYLNITVSWWGGGGTAVLQHNQGGGWSTNDNSLAGSAGVSGWTRSQTTPLHCWIEAEVPAHTPVLVGVGDSITVGTASTDPVGDSWASVYAYEMGAVPVILAMHGSRIDHWDDPAEPRFQQFPGFNLGAVADVVVSTLGQNDLVDTATTLSTLQARHEAHITALRALFPTQPVYLGEITASNKASDREVVRRDFNTWRATLPHGERGTIPWNASIATADDEALRPEYTSDSLHPNTEGQKVMAGVVEAAPVTPRVLSGAQVSALADLLA